MFARSRFLAGASAIALAAGATLAGAQGSSEIAAVSSNWPRPL
jgi:hypothetical protein